MQFLDIVASNRPRIDRAKLINEYGAHIFAAEKAFELGYVDAADATLNNTLTLLAAAMGVKEGEYQVVHMESKSWFTDLVSSRSPLLTGELKHEFKLNSEFGKNLFYYGNQ